ncbi:MAG: putative porin, partial [Bacteroidia bacterium]|nr:putative porin [Bacteroidia bacterium]
LRFRTGVPTSIHSPHVNLGYKGLGMVPFNLDKIFFRYEKGEYWGWVGKNSFPFWKQNELFWDDDVLPEGLVFGAKYKAGSVDVSPTAAYFMANNIPVDGNSAFPFNGSGKGFGNGDNYGDIIGAQIKLSHKNDNYQGVASFGYYDMNDIFTTPELSFDAADETGPYLVLNYKFLMASLQFKSFVIWDKWPITLGYDFVTNMEDYEDEKYDETFDDLGLRDQLRKETTSHTASISVGRSGQKGDWQFTYYYAHKEMFSVVSYFTEDDWVRWGNIHANRNTNYSGHEFRLVYTIAKNFNVVTRFYTLEALERRRPGDDQLESGNRLRVDFNISF